MTGGARLLAAVVAVGDELLEGKISEGNAALVARSLHPLGIELLRVSVEPDDEERIAAAILELAREAAYVFVTGGLGPTLDDVTRHGAARAAGVELEECPVAMEELARLWRGRPGEMPAANRRQALLPRGSVRLANRAGTAPGFRLEAGGAEVVVLPGPPHEMRTVLEEEVLPWLREREHPAPIARAQFHLFGITESGFADRVGDWMVRRSNPEVSVTARGGVLSVRMLARGETADEAARVLAERAEPFRERFREELFSETDGRPEVAAARALLARGVTVATAESCTGGLVAARLTDVPGISAVFADGFVTYSNEAKVRRLGVSPALLETHGAVSEEVARAMAEGAATMSGARLAVSTTGVAGPDGGSPEKPVGLVWFGVHADGETHAFSRRFPARSRAFVRELAARAALHALWLHCPGGRPEPDRP